MKEPMRTYGSASGLLYELYDFDDKIVVTLDGIPQLLCDISDDYVELIETHERNTDRTGTTDSEEVGAG